MPGPTISYGYNDYHLMGVGQALRERQFVGRTAFFLHIPFPPLDLFPETARAAQAVAARCWSMT